MYVLVADDDDSSRYLLQTLLSASGHEVATASDGVEALEMARTRPPDLIVTDILMPNMDGYRLCREWRADPVLFDVPFVFYSANYTEPGDERFAKDLGADAFLVKPTDPEELLAVVEGLMSVSEHGGYTPHLPSGDESSILREHNARLIDKLERQLVEVKSTNEQLRIAAEQFSAMVDGTIAAIAKLVEARDPYTAGHQERVADLAASIAQEMQFEPDFIEGVRIAGVIHDIGKIYVPAEILSKPSRLNDVEFSLIKMHPQVAYDVLASIAFPWPIADYVVQHHERMNGSGYPEALRGADILPGSRILAVADVVEAMSSHRPYKVAAGVEAALSEIQNGSGQLYDPDVAEACMTVFRERSYELPATPNLGAVD